MKELLRLVGVLLLSVALQVCVVWSSEVNVALQTSFCSAPYLLELLETAAAENQTAYFPLLDRIADGVFAHTTTDQELYNTFLRLLQDEGHISNPETLATFQFAVSIRSAAPRIEAHYQLYDTSIRPLLGDVGDHECSTWVHFHGKQYCSPTLHKSQGSIPHRGTRELQLDHILNNQPDVPPSILYTDFSDPHFGHFHKVLSASAREGKASYRVRYTPKKSVICKPLAISGYGIELALKRTDYIVIDDRESQPATQSLKFSGKAEVDEEDKIGLRPLPKSDVSQLGLKTASYVMSSHDPFKALLDVTQDYPSFSSTVALQNISEPLARELVEDRALSLQAGVNMLWMNGIRFDNRQIDAHTLLHHLRLERKLVIQLCELGFSGPEAIKVLTRTDQIKSKVTAEVARFDFRDDLEDSKAIIWMNNVEKDKRYKGWSSSITGLLQPTYPGQLPTVRRDIHNMVVPVDLSKAEDVQLVVGQLQGFIKRSIPIRFGLVLLSESRAAADHAKVIYFLLETYGLPSIIVYLEACLERGHHAKPHHDPFDAAVEGRSARTDAGPMSLDHVLTGGGFSERFYHAGNYARRLDATTTTPPVFVNGVAIPRDEEWLSSAVERVSLDFQSLQEAIIKGEIPEDMWLPSHFLSRATTKRSTLLAPEDEDSLEFIDFDHLLSSSGMNSQHFPQWKADDASPKEDWASLALVIDYTSDEGRRLLDEALQVRAKEPGVQLLLLHNNLGSDDNIPAARNWFDSESKNGPASLEYYVEPNADIFGLKYSQSVQSIVRALGMRTDEIGLVLNGRLIRPIPPGSIDHDDLFMLLKYERTRRSRPLHTALKDLNLKDKISDHGLAAKLVSIVAFSTKFDVAETIFETAASSRADPYEGWDAKYSTIAVGDPTTALSQIIVALDPASEIAQRWVPILTTLSELSGMYIKMFLNPLESLQELPVKRYYRQVLQSRPSFDDRGSIKDPKALFYGMPKDALLTVGMDVPPAWLVMPKESVHDLDNIKLETLQEGEVVDALYELKYILIEGHSREVKTGRPPRGAQLMLGTDKEPHATDTIIMANLGYLQFKASPGLWKVDLLPGRSQEVFSISRADSKGYASRTDDGSIEIELLTFQGRTLFPRLSRKPGRELEDVLAESATSTGRLSQHISKGIKIAQEALSKLGWSKESKHADINIFSVASGHLYERMLNIMMVSVMKHTKHTVKFWFIEQFLSPSFRQSIPILAAEYHFDYEMVSYKWPHWLREQREKQREIWGHKILFLDVLFPLSLDKVIFVDADQIVRTDMYDLVTHNLEGAAYGFTPMCDSRTEMEGFRFWKQGYWKSFLRGLPYHISALYVVDLRKFRQIAAGDRLRQQYHQLSADPNSLSNLDQDLPNHMQHTLPIHSLPQSWLWCETWCSDADLRLARTIDLCNNPMTKEPKLERARRQVPEWTSYDEEIRGVIRRTEEARSQVKVADENAFISTSPLSQQPLRVRDEL